MDKTQVVMEEANGVLDFWFGELSPEQWFKEDAALDKTITSQFSKLHSAAKRGELWPWRATATGRPRSGKRGSRQSTHTTTTRVSVYAFHAQ